jgi:ABC-type amino acid transport substrate-binding protein
MKALRLLAFVLAGGCLLVDPAALLAQVKNDKPLRVCLEANSGLYSFKRGTQQGGFDVLVAEAVAARLDRHLSIIWFETEQDKESNPVWETNALLSADVCDLVGGYAFFHAALGTAGQPTSTLPNYDSRNPQARGRVVQLGTLVASRPYHFAPFTIVLGPGARDRRIERLSDLADLRLGSEVSTLASAILLSYQSGLLVRQIVHTTSLSDLWRRLEAGEFDATLMELHRFNAYRVTHPETRLRAAAYRHTIGFNMGFVTLEDSRALLAQVNRVLDELDTLGQFATFAQMVGLTYVAPREPMILERITPRMLGSD